MKVSISTLLTLTLLVAITVQAGRVGMQCLRLEIEMLRHAKQNEQAVGSTVEKRTSIELFQNALAAESPASLLERARERHDALLIEPTESEPIR